LLPDRRKATGSAKMPFSVRSTTKVTTEGAQFLSKDDHKMGIGQASHALVHGDNPKYQQNSITSDRIPEEKHPRFFQEQDLAAQARYSFKFERTAHS
ncbi:MAG TPA: hypothetical protein VJ854_03745, partial [Sphaerochaeta sp.]|nr:hypothetical protein [Sphaerochaeta sp.]